MLTTEKNPFGVRMGNRTYPAFKQIKKTAIPAVVESIDEHSPQKLREQLVNSLQELFPFLSLQQEIKDKSELFAQYVDNLAILGRCREEALQLAKAMVETSIDLAPEKEAVENIDAEILTPILKSGEVTISKPKNFATAEMAALESREIQRQLQKCLQESIENFVAELFDALDSLVDQFAAGLVHWTSSNTVKYHFFRRSIKEKPSTVAVTDVRIEERDISTAALITENTTSTPVVVSLAHHKHDLANAIQTSLDNSTVTMPPFVKKLVEAIPTWMRPSIHIVEGYLICEKIYECELFTKELIIVEYEEELIHGYDPAVCFGPYVLIGWGPQDIHAEQQRQEKKNLHQRYLQNANFWGLSALASQAFCALFAHLGFFLLSLILFVLGIACITQWVGRTRQENVSEWKRQRIGFGFVALLGGLQLLITSLSFWRSCSPSSFNS